jgi:hypothetical protein
MSKIRYLILLLSLPSIICACGYSFVLKGGGNLGAVNLLDSSNQTVLRSSAIILDTYMENALSAYGLYSTALDRPKLKCTVASASKSEITSNPIGTQNRYRLTVTVRVELYDKDNKKIWENNFSDDGEYSTGGEEEDGLNAAFNKISVRIAQAISALKV